MTRRPTTTVAIAGLIAAASMLAAWSQTPPALRVDYPGDNAIFPPEITPPTFLFRDSSNATSWTVDIEFANHSPALHDRTAGARPEIDDIDPEAVSPNNEPPRLNAEMAEAHTWLPSAALWTTIKQRSKGSAATLRINGYRDTAVVSHGEVHFQTSTDPVGAPVFFRDVPLMPNQSDKGVVKPLPPDAVGLIKWRLRYINEPQSRTVMERISTCANCHSFSADGKTLGLDVDGPQNDRGLYALIPVAPKTAIKTSNIIKWPAVRDAKVPRLRAAFMSQVSPDGRRVLTTIDDPDAVKRAAGETLEDKYYNANFMDYKFLQVFYPTRGILAWYDRASGELHPLPGANDPRYVQTDGVWSPDGKWIVFARATARSPYTPGAPMALFANDPNETQIQYDLYRIPFNDGRGGTPEPVRGASGNGFSNNFPKVSPDGRWIVFVRCRNAQLMRPDSELWIVPSSGGEARRMKCNTSLMNSWHTFSPNGRWMAFSSKNRSPYTQMYLTHIDANGNDSPPILVDRATAANRAVNLPEFVNIGPGGLEKIDAPATEFYRNFNTAIDLMKKGDYARAIPEWRTAIQLDDGDSQAHFNLAYALGESGNPAESIVEYRKAADIDPKNALILAHLALALAQSGNFAESVATYRRSVALQDANPTVLADFAMALLETGAVDESVKALRRAIELAPEAPEPHSRLGTVLARSNRLPAAIDEFAAAVRANPASPEYQFNYGFALGLANRHTEAVTPLEASARLSAGTPAEWQCLAALAEEYFQAGRKPDAIAAAEKALTLSANQPRVRQALERYRN